MADVEQLLAGIEVPSRPVFALVRSLAALPEVPSQAVARLLRLCPAEPALRAATPRATASDLAISLDTRSQEGLLAMALLLLESGQHTDRLLPPLLVAVKLLGVPSTLAATPRAGVFAQLLVALLLGAHKGDPAAGAMDAVLQAVPPLVAAQLQAAARGERAAAHVLGGVLRALCLCRYAPPAPAAAVLLGELRSLLESDAASTSASEQPPGGCVRAASLAVLRRLLLDASARGGQGGGEGGAAEGTVRGDVLFELAHATLSRRGSAEAVSTAVSLSATCARAMPALCQRVVTLLLEALRTVVAAPAPNTELLQRILSALHELCEVASDAEVQVRTVGAQGAARTGSVAQLLPAVVRELKQLLLPAEGQEGAAPAACAAGSTAYELCLKTLCSVLRLESDPRPAASDTLSELADGVRRATRAASSTTHRAADADADADADAEARERGACAALRPLPLLVPLLGRITCGLGHAEGINLACPLLVDTCTFLQERRHGAGVPRGVAAACTELLPLVVEQVTATAVVALEAGVGGAYHLADEYLRMVTELLSTAYVAPPYPWAAQQAPLMAVIRAALLRLRDAVVGDAERRPWLEGHVLSLFAKLGQLVHSTVMDDAGGAGVRDMTAYKTALGELLPVLAAVITPPSEADSDAARRRITTPTDAQMLLYRDVWYYLVLFALVDLDSWAPERDDWHLALRRIAAGSPVLLVRRDGFRVGKAIELELEHNTTVRRAGQNMSIADIAALRAPVERYLPAELAGTIAAQPFHNFLFLASLYYLETIRALSGTCEPVFTYMAIANQCEPGVGSCLDGVISQVFSFWLEAMLQRAATPSRDGCLQRLLMRLLPYVTSRAPRLATMATAFSSAMLERFPSLHWSTDASFTLLDLLNDASARIEAGEAGDADHAADGGGAGGGGGAGAVVVAGATALAPVSASAQGDELEQAQALCRSWFAQATALAPTATQVLLQSYHRKKERHGAGHSATTNWALHFAMGVWSGKHRRGGGGGGGGGGAGTMTMVPMQRSSSVGLAGGGGTASESDAESFSDTPHAAVAPTPTLSIPRTNSRQSLSLRVSTASADEAHAEDGAAAGGTDTAVAASSALQAFHANRMSTHRPMMQDFSNTLMLAAHYQGEVHGMRALREMQQQQSAADPHVGVAALDEQLKSHLLEQFALLQSKSEAAGGACDAATEKDVIACVYRAVALLVTAESGTVPSAQTLSLLHHVASAPSLLLTPRAMRAATFAWQWLAVLLPGLATTLVDNICAAWVRTLHEGRGLFSGMAGGRGEVLVKTGSEAAPKNALFAAPDGDWLGHGSASAQTVRAEKRRRDASLKTLRREAAAHAIWLDFLQDWVNVAQRSAAQMDSFTRLLLASLANPRALSHRRDCFAPRFRLLRLALFVTSSRLPHERVEATCSLLNERVVAAALCWFEAEQLCEPAADARGIINGFLEACASISVAPGSVNLSAAQLLKLQVKAVAPRGAPAPVPAPATPATPASQKEGNGAGTQTPLSRGSSSDSAALAAAGPVPRPATGISASMHEFGKLRNLAASDPAVVSPMTVRAKGGRMTSTPSSANLRAGMDGRGAADRPRSGSAVGRRLQPRWSTSKLPFSPRNLSHDYTPVKHALGGVHLDAHSLPARDAVTVFHAVSRNADEGAGTLPAAHARTCVVPVVDPGNWLRRRIALLELLLTSELDKWSAHNMVAPGRSRTREGMKSEGRSLDARKRLSQQELEQHLSTAWEHSPRLAFRTLQALQGAGAGPRQEQFLAGFVRANPGAAMHLPDALPSLLPAALDAQSGLARQLLYWAACPLPTTVGILSRCAPPAETLSSPEAVRYAMRAMQCFAPETLVFFLPQLVHSLRGDGLGGGIVRGLLSQHLLETSQLSMLIAHQLVWQLVTESRTEPPEHGKAYVGRYGFQGRCPGEDPLPATAEALKQRILACMTPAAQKFFRLESSYFDAVTNISGQLAKVLDKTQHNGYIKDKLVNHVQADGMKEGLLYLPTSPYSQVVGVDVESGTPMQSAAKCPFLLVFKVKPFSGPDEALKRVPDGEDGDAGALAKHGAAGGGAGSAVTDVAQAAQAAAGRDSDFVPRRKRSRSRLVKVQRKMKKTMKKAKGKMGKIRRPSNIRSLANSRLVKISKARKMGKKRKKFEKRLAKHPTPAASAVSQACIFKVYDDCRQDILCIQIIQLFSDAFQSAGLPLYLKPYRVIANRTGDDMAIGGIIEVVPQCRSRDQLGKAGSRDLFRYFQTEYGSPSSRKFQQAQYNFAVSMAAYAIVCYIMWIKDRHNGNLLVDNLGHVVHIDFGFLLGISPGGNLGFETAAFKLTKEMVDILGGSTEAKPFKFFMELCVKGYLAARAVRPQVNALIASMADSGLPCFHFAHTLDRLNERFKPQLNDIRAAKYMRKLVFDANQKATTTIYDGIQKLQNNIHSDFWR
eukprot:g237.t1